MIISTGGNLFGWKW